MTLRSAMPAPRMSDIRALRRRLYACAVSAAMVLSISACASNVPDTASGNDGQTSGSGTVAVFTPTDGVTISGNSPLNKWAEFTPALSSALRELGMPKKRISISSADSLDKQSRDIQDYVVDRISSRSSSDADSDADDASNAKDTGSTTLVIAPVASTDDTTRQYGDYVGQHLTASSKSSDESSDSSAPDNESTEQAQSDDEAISRLVSALELARENGMHVIMLSSTVEGIQPDVYVRMSTAEMIGKVQATKLVAKLDLDKVSKDNPKNIEVLMPVTPLSAQKSGDLGSVLGLATGQEASDDPTESSAEFARDAFKGLWSVLKPYFASGKAISPSGALTASTTDDDWRDVTFPCVRADDIGAELRNRLEMKSRNDRHTRVDGIIAMNDYTASKVTEELSDLGYTGTAADINPSITISGIVDNITGRKDLQRDEVPDPIKAPESSDDTTKDGTASSGSDDDKSVESANSRWPIVTGYGAYTVIMPQIVSGQQWMTALEDRATLAESTAKACIRLNSGKALDEGAGITSLVTSKINGKDTPTISGDLIAVSASNLKSTLIDPGYITPADAGL